MKNIKSGRSSDDGQFTRLPRRLLTSEQWKTLPPAARSIFIYGCTLHYPGGKRGPGNNGRIAIGAMRAGRAANVSQSTAYRMINLLRDAGLFRKRKDSTVKFVTRADGKKVKIGDGTTREFEIPIYNRTADWANGALHLPHWMLKSDAYRALSGNYRCTLIEMMRRWTGSNNGDIRFGGEDGVYIGLSADATERSLRRLEGVGFIVRTHAANPRLRQRRRWELTMYKVGRSAAKKLFMVADESVKSSSLMRAIESPEIWAFAHAAGENTSSVKHVAAKNGEKIIHASEKVQDFSIRASESHLEAISGPPDSQPATEENHSTRPRVFEAQPSLFNELSLPTAPPPQDQLMSDLKSVVARKRGMQSRVAESLGMSRHTLANALAGRKNLTKPAAALLRQWLSGESMHQNWPALPNETKDQTDAA